MVFKAFVKGFVKVPRIFKISYCRFFKESFPSVSFHEIVKLFTQGLLISKLATGMYSEDSEGVRAKSEQTPCKPRGRPWKLYFYSFFRMFFLPFPQFL